MQGIENIYGIFDYLRFGIIKSMNRRGSQLEIELELYYFELEVLSAYRHLSLLIKNNTYINFELYSQGTKILQQSDNIARLQPLIIDLIKIGPSSPGINCYILESQEQVEATSGRLTLDGELDSITDANKSKLTVRQLSQALVSYNQFLIENKKLKHFKKQLSKLIKVALVPLFQQYNFKGRGKIFHHCTSELCKVIDIQNLRWNSDLGLQFSITFYLFGGIYKPGHTVAKLDSLYHTRSLVLFQQSTGPIKGGLGLNYTINGRITDLTLQKMLSIDVEGLLKATCNIHNADDLIHFMEEHPEKVDLSNLAIYCAMLGRTEKARRFVAEAQIDSDKWQRLKSAYNL